jgi:hypothetical protein
MALSLFDELEEENKLTNEKYTINELFKRSLKYKTSKDFLDFFNFIASFNHYSSYNSMLVYIQNPNVTFFGSHTFWKKRERIINSEAKPLLILCPNGPMMCVYDIYDTSGKKTAEEFLKDGSKVKEIEGKISQYKYKKILEEVNNWGIKLSFKPLSFFNGGYITTIFSGKLEIVLKEKTTNEENFSVLIHELAHLFLGHTGHKELLHIKNKKKINLSINNELKKNYKELEAETVSYLVCNKVGLKSTASDYLAHYIKDEKDLNYFNYELVIKTADKIEKLFL